MNKTGINFSIIMGTVCNWHCSYCLQDKQVKLTKNYNIDLFCENLDKYISENNLENKIGRFVFWGGEPLVYWKNLQKLILHFSKYRTLRPNRIATNGSLLTEDNVSFFNENNIFVNLSYHEGQLSNEQWKKVAKLNDVAITSLIHHKCTTIMPYLQAWNNLANYTGKYFQWYVYPLLDIDGVDKNYVLTKKDVDEFIDHLYACLAHLNNAFINKVISVLYYKFNCSIPGSGFINPCFNNNNFGIDLDGNRYLCHHCCTHKYSNIFEKSKNIPILPEILYRSQVEPCKSCNLNKYCLGGCFRHRSQDVWCYYQHRMYEFLKYTKENYAHCFNKYYLNFID